MTIVIGAVVSVVVGGLLNALLAAIGHRELAFLANSAGIFAAAAANWFIGKLMNASTPRVLVDPATNEQVVLRRLHKLFWIRIEYWSIPVAILGFVPLLALFGH